MGNTVRYDFEVNVGTDFYRAMRWKNEDGTYVDFTDYEIVMTIRYDSKNGELFDQLNNSNGITTASDRFTISMSDTKTSLLDINKQIYYDIFITKDNDTQKPFEGKITTGTRIKPKGVDE